MCLGHATVPPSCASVLFDNEGHGFTKKANEIRAYKAILDFLDRYLKRKLNNKR